MMKKLYATWFNHCIITDMSAKKEILSYRIPSWSSKKGYTNRADYTTMSSPSLGIANLLNGYWSTGEFNERYDGGGGTTYGFGARPALHHLRFIIDGLL